MDCQMSGEVSEKKVKDLSGAGTLKTYPVIHFACHGYFNEEDPAMSGIVFSEVSGLVNTGEDGYLTVPEIALLDMDARMVVLSACETGLGQVKRGDGMVGLARSFLVAGARNVGVSLWSIRDEATVEVMGRLYRKVIQ
jgi:CHAT domain-containing protein